MDMYLESRVACWMQFAHNILLASYTILSIVYYRVFFYNCFVQHYLELLIMLATRNRLCSLINLISLSTYKPFILASRPQFESYRTCIHVLTSVYVFDCYLVDLAVDIFQTLYWSAHSERSFWKLVSFSSFTNQVLAEQTCLSFIICFLTFADLKLSHDYVIFCLRKIYNFDDEYFQFTNIFNFQFTNIANHKLFYLFSIIVLTFFMYFAQVFLSIKMLRILIKF